MDIEKRKRDGMSVCFIKGAMTIYEISSIHEELKNCLEGEEGVVLNIAGVTDCDLTGLQMLYSASLTAKSQESPFHVEQPSPAVCGVAQRAGINVEELMDYARECKDG